MAKFLCMEVGTSTVRLAEVAKKGKFVEITKTYVFDTPDDATKDGKVRVSDTVVSAIKDGLDDSGIKATDVYFVVESTKILFKQIEIPYIQKKMIQSTLDLSFSDYFPVDETLYHISYMFKKTYEKNGQKVMVLDVFAIPNDLSESYYNLSVALGLNAKGLSDTSHSMMCLFPDTFKNRSVAMVNINENVSTLTIAVDGDMVFNKTIPHGVHNTIRQVINSPLTMDSIDVTGASELLYSQNILMKQIPEGIVNQYNEEDNLRYNATMSVVSLIKSIESTFSAFLAKENIQIQEFHLSGLGAGFAGISQLLTYEFGIPVTIIQQGGKLRVNPSVADEVLLLSCYPCVGSLLDKTNFFTAAEKAGGEIAHRKRIDRTLIMTSALICCATFTYGTYSWMNANDTYQDAYTENMDLTKEIQMYRDSGAEVVYNKHQAAVSYNENVKNLYDQTRSGNEDITAFLKELETLVPMTARVTAITLTPDTAAVSFMCEDRFVAAGLLHLLRNMTTINSMDCRGVGEVVSSNEIAFTCNFSLKSTAEREALQEALEAEQDALGNEQENLTDIVDDSVDEHVDNETESDLSVDDEVLSKTAEINTVEDVSNFTLEGASFNINTLTVDELEQNEFTTIGEFNMAVNQAVEFGGLNYSNPEGVAFAVEESADGIAKIEVKTDAISFYNGIHVGMSKDDALLAINDPAVMTTDEFIIMKNTGNTLILCMNGNDAKIEAIYLVNNYYAYSTESVDETSQNATNEDTQSIAVEEGE